MTCIVGLERKGHIYLGGDSAAVDDTNIFACAEPKVFKNGDFIIGYTTSFRMGQVLQHAFKPPAHKKSKTDVGYLVTDVVEAIRKTFADAGILTKKNDVDECGTFLLGYNSKIYTIESDFQVNRSTLGYAACGSGIHYALGSMHTSLKLDPEMKPRDFLTHALEAASQHSPSVIPPYHFISM